MAKPEKFDHLHLVYHFTVPLKINKIILFTKQVKLGSYS